jgi:hypothetical protein
MSNLTLTPAWVNGIYQIEPEDPVVGGPDGISNIQAKQLGSRTEWLKEQLAAAQQDLEAVGTDGQNALWAAVERAVAEVGLLTKEMNRQQTVRHQEGEFVLVNRGVKNGCGLTKSATANRNLSIASGVCFMHGREMPVNAEDNAASVPSNSSAESATAEAYLAIINGSVRLGVTNLNESAPDDALVLAQLSVPAGSTGTTAPELEDVTITTVARTEPEWPSVHTSPAFKQQDFERVMGASNYHLSLDVVAYLGGEKPTLQHEAQDRASNTFRVYLGGSADSVRVRFLAHLMQQ